MLKYTKFRKFKMYMLGYQIIALDESVIWQVQLISIWSFISL